jgi:hypothetical protein
VTVTDENGCTLVLAATVGEPALLLATAVLPTRAAPAAAAASR